MKILKWVSLAAIAGLLFVSSANASTLYATLDYTGPGQTNSIGDFLTGGEVVDLYLNIQTTVDLQMILEGWNLFTTGGNTGLSPFTLTLFDAFDLGGTSISGSLAPGEYDFASGLVPAGQYSLLIQGTALPGGGAYQVTLSSVPLPAALWLFGSALVGFVGMGRRKAAA